MAQTGMLVIRKAREAFLDGGVAADVVPVEIARSWARSSEFQVRHDRPEPPQIPVEQLDDRLLRSVGPILDRLAERLVDTNVGLLLSDTSARILRRWSADTPVQRFFDRVQTHRGSQLSEEAVGTNGVGTPVVLGRLVNVQGPEHVLDIYQRAVCTGAPIRDPLTRRTIGAVTLSCTLSPHSGLLVPLLLSTMAEVEQHLLELTPPQERQLLHAFLATARASGRPVVGLLGGTRLATDEARRLLTPLDVGLLEQVVADLPGGAASTGPAGIRFPVTLSGGRSTVATLRSAGEGAGWVIELAMAPAGDPAGLSLPDPRADGLALGGPAPGGQAPAGSAFGPDGFTIPGLPDPSGPVAAPPAALHRPPAPRPGQPPRSGLPGVAGDSTAWRAVVRAAHLYRRSSMPVLVTGDSGVGKTAIAIAMCDSPEVEVLDGAMEQVDGTGTWLGRLRTSLHRPGGATVVRHLDALSDTAAQAACGIIDTLAGPVTLVGTSRGPAPYGTATAALLERFSIATIAVPPLGDHIGDLPELVRELSTRHGRGRVMTLSPEALEAMRRYPWPGNVRQLETVVRRLIAEGVGFPVPLSALPIEIASAARTRSLTTLEELELKAIRAALRSAEGNRAKAAASLGISRATLYRRLRAHGSLLGERPL